MDDGSMMSARCTAQPVGWTHVTRKSSVGLTCQTATFLRTCDIAPVVCGAGAPSWFAFPPLVRGRAERRVPDAPLGLMPMRSSAKYVHQDFRKHGQVPSVPHAVFDGIARPAQMTPRSPHVWPLR